MGKTTRKLTIVALPPCDEWPELAKLAEQGHIVIRLSVISFKDCDEQIKAFEGADLIIGANAWYMDHQHRKYLTEAIKASRLKRYGKPKIKKKGGKKDEALIERDEMLIESDSVYTGSSPNNSTDPNLVSEE